MKITVTSTVLHNRTHILPDTVADVDDDTAANWIERGIAEAHAEPQRFAVTSEKPAPMVASIETTPLPAGPRRGRRPKAKDE